MDRDRSRRLAQLLDAALPLNPEARERFLDETCAGDQALRDELVSLVAALEEDPSFLEVPALGEMEAAVPPPIGAEELIGPYRVQRLIRAGGMGAVYLALRDDGAERPVAIKLMHPGLVGATALARFARERRILATLDHPHICRLLDWGLTTGGRPFLVMPFLEDALSITEYCDHHRLSVRERVALFRDVCAAVHHAHQNLVVHSDLKPANVLVTADGRVQLVDFGIARLLGGGTDMVTGASSARPLTPAYASPEQIRGQSPTTASDVYGLGVLLYEMLSGSLPYMLDMTNAAALVHAICESEPVAPSSAVHQAGAEAWSSTPARLSAELRGDLDTIVLCAMAKEPSRRYGGAAALSDDLERWLDGRPVTARNPTWRYQAGKFVRRHRWASLATATTLVALVGFVVALSLFNTRIRAQSAELQTRSNELRVQSDQLRAQSEQLEVERDRAEGTAKFLTGLFEEASPGARSGAANTAGELLDRGFAKLRDSDSLPPSERAAALAAVGSAYRQMGRYGEAESAMQGAVDSYEKEAVPSQAYAQALLEYANLQFRLERYADAEQTVRRGIAVLDATSQPSAAQRASQRNTLALALRRQGRLDEAIRILEEVVVLRRTLPDADSNTDLAANLNNLGDMLHEEGRHAEAEPKLAESLAIFERGYGPDHVSVAFLLNSYANLRLAMSDLSGAEEMLQRAQRVASERLGPKHPFSGYVMRSIAKLHRERGDHRASLEATQRAIAVFRTALPPTSIVLGDTLIDAAGDAARVGEAASADDLLIEAMKVIGDGGLPERQKARERAGTVRASMMGVR
ncbi:MAG TPA: tetratricopeptide repeat protein [Thermoanaerobaculia bacterium]